MDRNRVNEKIWVILAACLVVVTVSGCTGAPPHEEGDPSAHGDGPGLDDAPASGDHSLGFGDCTTQAALIPAPSDIVEGEIPEGFAPVYGDDAGATSLIGLSGTTCADATSQDVSADHAEFRFYALVEPPPEWQNDSVDDYYVLFFVTTSDASAAQTYAEWGHWVENRDVLVESDDMGTSSFGTVRSAHAAEEWEVRTAVDSANEQCYEDKHIRSFAEGPDGITGYVDMKTGPGCAWIGTAKVTLPEAPTSDPMDLVVWAGLNGMLTGQGRHVVEPTTLMQEYTPFP